VTRETELLSRLRLAALPVVVIVSVVLAWRLGYFDIERRQHFVSVVEHIRLWPWAEAAYVVVYAFAISICLPAAVATMLGGAVFGTLKGAALAWVGSLVGTVFTHWLARSVARTPMKRLFGEHRLLRQLKDHDDVSSLLRLRILPVAPFAVLDYVAGIAGVSARRLVLATMLGVLPTCLAYAYVGSELMRGLVSRTEASHRALWIAVGVTIIMLALSVVPRLAQKLRS
jgi:uncharacterized membrane protein YdjX (TVP38/TMEM64 family)